VLSVQVINLSRINIGADIWPFNREEVILNCEKKDSIFIINPSTLTQYPLNDEAKELAQRKNMNVSSIKTIQKVLSNHSHPDKRVGLDYMKEYAISLCG
jgi:hypothetical protein